MQPFKVCPSTLYFDSRSCACRQVCPYTPDRRPSSFLMRALSAEVEACAHTSMSIDQQQGPI